MSNSDIHIYIYTYYIIIFLYIIYKIIVYNRFKIILYLILDKIMIYGNLLDDINKLPIIVKEKIISFYMLNYLKENCPTETINSLYSSFGFKQFDLICVYFDKFDKHGYIQITSRDLLLIYQNFKSISFNNICKATCKTIIDECWKSLQLYYT